MGASGWIDGSTVELGGVDLALLGAGLALVRERGCLCARLLSQARAEFRGVHEWGFGDHRRGVVGVGAARMARAQGGPVVGGSPGADRRLWGARASEQPPPHMRNRPLRRIAVGRRPVRAASVAWLPSSTQTSPTTRRLRGSGRLGLPALARLQQRTGRRGKRRPWPPRRHPIPARWPSRRWRRWW